MTVEGRPAETPMGRPKSKVAKPHQVNISEDAQNLANKAAGLAGLSTSDWVIRAINRQATTEIDAFTADWAKRPKLPDE